MVYEQAPYQDCSQDTYKEFSKKMPEFIDWTKLKDYETEDNTVGNQTLACTADSCEVVDIGK
jgi:ribonucleoside-diphosphate reductase alpha chain